MNKLSDTVKTKDSQKGSVWVWIILALTTLTLVSVIGLSLYKQESKPTQFTQKQTTPVQRVTPLPASVVAGKLIVQTTPKATVTLKFWTWQWVPSTADTAKRELKKVEIASSESTKTTNPDGKAEFDVTKIPTAVEADILIVKESAKTHFLATLDPSYGAVFVVSQEGDKLTVDLAGTNFAPGKAAGEFHGPDTLKADQKASLAVLE